jgi:hypothetical protein
VLDTAVDPTTTWPAERTSDSRHEALTSAPCISVR